MTLTFDSNTYVRLLTQYQPKVITTDEECEKAIALAEELEHSANRTLEEDALLELILTLVEKYEEVAYPIPEGDPHSLLLHLLEENHLKQEDLGVIGSRVVSEVINGKRSISKNQAKELAKLFKIDVGLLI